MTDEQIVNLWRDQVVVNAEALDAENDKGGHDWHSLWTGFVTAHGRIDLTSWSDYMRLGFPVEKGM